MLNPSTESVNIHNDCVWHARSLIGDYVAHLKHYTIMLSDCRTTEDMQMTLESIESAAARMLESVAALKASNPYI